MPLTEKEHRQSIVEIGRLIYQKGWVASNDGNISIRLAEDRILSTPTGVSKGMMTVDDLIVCNAEGKKIEGKRERTSEILMHTTVYSLRPDVQAVVHAHCPMATGFAVAGRPLNTALLPEVVVALGCVPLAGYGLPGTPELSDVLTPYIPKYDALLMANHGVVCYAEDVYKAFFKMETVEHFARIALVAELLGGGRALPRQEVERLFDARNRYGVTSRNTFEQGCPVPAEDVRQRVPGETFLVTRDELIALVDEALQAKAGNG